ncbi:nucleolar protein 4 isoform X3 [Aedes albopictus]|uniref:Nucleolar protein 4 helical domain-containing protein n=1 Tax=Aedes albopictus TaxID=7160 RepID=A0ABM1ZNI4_AEDAL
MSSFELFGRPFSTGEEIRENRMESHGHLNIFGANRTESTLRKMLSSEPFTNTDKTHHSPTSSSSALFGENILENFSLQPNFLRRQQALQEQHHRNKRKRKESSLSSCSSSSSLLSLVSSSERRQTSAVSGVAAVGGDDGENPFVVGGREGARKEQCAQQKSEKSLSSSSFRSADLNECSPYASRGTRDSSGNNRSMRQPEVQEEGGGGGDDEHDSPRRKRPKYDYTRDQMFEIFQPWVIRTYGDRAKTKTITLKKQARIIKALKGQEMNNPDSSKFRFWVKTKGFTTSKPEGFQDIFAFHNQEENDGCLLFAPNTAETDSQPFKKVAVVENFFNIIYGVHVSLGSRSSRHAGQKRTYRTITETYAFLPREAVTKFLSLCSQCSKALRPHSPAKTERTESPLTTKTDESFDDRETKECSLPKRVSSPQSLLPNSFSDGSSSFDRLNSEEVYSKLIDYYKVQNGERDGAMYYQLLKTFYDNATKKNGGGAVGERVAKEVEKQEEPVVDLTGTPESDKTSVANSRYVSKSASNENCVFAENGKLPDGEMVSVGIEDRERSFNEGDQSSKELIVCEAGDVSEKIKLNSTHDDDSEDSDSDSDIDGNDSRPITSTYLDLTRSMGVTDDDALNMDSLSMPFNNETPENNGTTGAAAGEDAYAGLIKDADKFKLMLLAWNYQNSAAGKSQNGTEGPDLATMTNLWQQYQNALAMNAKTSFNQLPIPERQQPSPIEQQDETNSSEQKDDDDLSEDDSEDRIEATVNDPERLKAFNMFVRLFVDENLDRIIPISKQPKEKIQAIIDSCTRQFPEFAERARKRIRTYLKSCRRNKKTREGWENTSRPTPAHLTSVQAEQILALACENESLNAKRMRIGLEPISQSVNQTTAVSFMTSEPPNVPSLYQTLKCETEAVPAVKTEPMASVPKMSPIQNTTPDMNQMKLNIPSASASSTPTIPTTVPTISNFHDYNTGFTNRSQHYQNFMNSATNSTSTSTTMSATGTAPTDLSMKRPILAHKLNSAEITAVKQLVTGYRESAAFLMRSADELENLLLQQQ